MATTLTITLDDDGKITVDSPEAKEPYVCDSIDECLQFVEAALREESGESMTEESTEPKEDYGKMWSEEAKKRGQEAAAPGMY